MAEIYTIFTLNINPCPAEPRYTPPFSHRCGSSLARVTWESQVLLMDGQVGFSPGSPVFAQL